ncbi:hypothetical protein BDR22DRAFT_886260 [Usnea florida]
MASPTNATSSEQAQASLRGLLEGPAMSPPTGVIPNFHDPPNLDAFVALTISLCIGFGTLAVALRMYTKVFILRVLAWEDYVIVLAWVLQIGETVPTILGTRHGAGTHMWNIEMHTFFEMLYWLNVGSILYGSVVFFIRISILLQYLRIFAPTRRGNMFIFVGVHICIWSNVIFYLAETVIEIAICTPRKKILNPLVTGHCFNVMAPIQASAIFNVFCDLAILILPMPCVWRLHLPLKKKILMTIIFAAGVFACVSSVLRTYYTWKMVGSPDMSYNIVPVDLWTFAELATGFIISCLPVIPKFFQHIYPKVSRALGGISKSRKYSGIESAPAIPGKEPERNLEIKLPNFKKTFASVFSHTEEEDDQTQPERKYAILSEEIVVTRPEAAMELSHMPAARLATRRYDLESRISGI